MSKVAVVYWSGTGNTAAMAEAVAQGARGAGASVNVFNLDESAFGGANVAEYDAIAFGCPAMGAEELEDGTILPAFESCEEELAGKKIGLFGSYGWGGGDWMASWEETCKNDGAQLAAESVICNEAPDDEAVASCKALGAALA
ncbi:MAG: flavodoxin [Oscillospiraceae bacterium]|nr:flavodoxin [Oscillospiraceae bacterium]